MTDTLDPAAWAAIEKDYRAAKRLYDRYEHQHSLIRQVLIDIEEKRHNAWTDLQRVAEMIPVDSDLARKLAEEQWGPSPNAAG